MNRIAENALDLFGFYTETEMECFKVLLSVSGVGPKVALAILSELTPDSMALAIASGDSKAITRANGVGPKLAQRIVLELKDKLAAGLDLGSSGIDVESANAAMNAAKAEAERKKKEEEKKKEQEKKSSSNKKKKD